MPRWRLIWFAAACLPAALAAAPRLIQAGEDGRLRYVGSQACRECHEDIYANYVKFSKKAHSFASVKKMRAKLTPDEVKKCYECHTTGYGKPGGFVSENQTPKMKNAGCEVCHGPGGRHAESEDPADIRAKLSTADCIGCHNSERVAAFNFRPLIYGGGH